MRILHLEASKGWGGQEIRILRESEGMRQRGHEVILCVMKGGRLAEEARKKGFSVYELNFKKLAWFVTFFRLLWIMRKHRIDLVNTHSSLDAWIGGLGAWIGKRALIRTRHLSTPIRPGWNSRFLYGKLAHYVVTTCESIVSMIAVQSGKPPSLCRSIATGVDPGEIKVSHEEREAFRHRFQLQESDFLIGTACFMRSWKGIDDLLMAAHQLREHRHLKWLIIGGGHVERHLQKAAELQLEGIVIFTGHQEPPFAAISVLDVFALLSTAHEGVSQAILQAAYLSKPLIATKVGGLTEVCLDRVTGIQVDPSSPDQVAKAVLELWGDPFLRKQLGYRAQKLVEEKFTFEQTLDQMERVYAQVLSPIVGKSGVS